MRVDLRFQTPLKHPATRLLFRKDLALKPRDPHIAAKPRIWRKISLQTTLRKELLTIKPFINSHLGQQQSMATHPFNHQPISSNQNILSQVERILHPDRLHRRKHGRLKHDSLLQLFQTYWVKAEVGCRCFYSGNPNLFEEGPSRQRDPGTYPQIATIYLLQQSHEDSSLFFHTWTRINRRSGLHSR